MFSALAVQTLFTILYAPPSTTWAATVNPDLKTVGAINYTCQGTEAWCFLEVEDITTKLRKAAARGWRLASGSS